jgi:Mce-associated membrane protein
MAVGRRLRAGPAPISVSGAADAVVPARAGWVVRALLAGIVVVALVTGALGVLYQRVRAVDAAREAGLAAARASATDLLSYDHRRLEADFARAKAHLTGEVARGYEATTAVHVAAAARSTRAVVEAQVVEASVVSASRSRVVTLLLVDQRTRSAASPQPRLDRNQVRLTLAKVGDRWLVSGFDAL